MWQLFHIFITLWSDIWIQLKGRQKQGPQNDNKWHVFDPLLFSLLLPAVQYQSGLYGGNNNNSSSPLSSRGNPAIACERCGEVCRGEVVRVKNTHFHVHCFTCQGKKKKEEKKNHAPTHTNMHPYIQCTLTPPHMHTYCVYTHCVYTHSSPLPFSIHTQCFVFIYFFNLGRLHVFPQWCGFHPHHCA